MHAPAHDSLTTQPTVDTSSAAGHPTPGAPSSEAQSPESATTPGAVVSREPRFSAEYQNQLPAHLIIDVRGELVAFAATISDISVGGCAIKADLPHGLSPTVGIVRLMNDDQTVMLEIAGKFVWHRQTSVGCKTLGMRFRRELEKSAVDSLVRDGIVSRREAARQTIDVPVVVRRQTGLEAIRDARLVDRSRTGIQLRCGVRLTMGEKILVTLPDGTGGIVGVVWTRGDDQSCEAGAVFLNLNSSRAVNEYQPDCETVGQAG